MRDVLMTICTYDDRAIAEADQQRLAGVGIESSILPCRYFDPDAEGPLVDLVVVDEDVAAAQKFLELVAADDPSMLPEEALPANPATLREADQSFRRVTYLFWAFLLLVAGALVLASSR